MIQCGGSIVFVLKTGECLQVFGHVMGQGLEGDVATEVQVFYLEISTRC
jgi:hypothetical protein